MNPALHVAHYAAAWAAVRNNAMQWTWDLVQQCTTLYQINIDPKLLILTIIFMLLLSVVLMIWFKKYPCSKQDDFTQLFWEQRINQILKSINKEK
jgi:hypothetical protein